MGRAIEIGTPIASTRGVRVMEQLIYVCRRLAKLHIDNGPKRTADLIADWCRNRGIELRYIQPGKSGQNAYIKRFNHSCREKVLSICVLELIERVGALAGQWLRTYDGQPPRDSLGRVPLLICPPKTNRPVESDY